jgi:hypothetical protein
MKFLALFGILCLVLVQASQVSRVLQIQRHPGNFELPQGGERQNNAGGFGGPERPTF